VSDKESVVRRWRVVCLEFIPPGDFNGCGWRGYRKGTRRDAQILPCPQCGENVWLNGFVGELESRLVSAS
jgi:hypothetical protein